MTQEHAIEIRQHLVNELNTHGFGDIVAEINTRLEEDFEDEGFENNARHLLIFFLSESIEVLENLSNKDFSGLLSRLNTFTSGEKKIEQINVELLVGQPEFYDLKNLPNYENIISTFREILNEVQKEN